MAPFEPDPTLYEPMLLMALPESRELSAGAAEQDPVERMRSRLQVHAATLLSPTTLPTRGLIEQSDARRLGEHALHVAAAVMRGLNDVAARTFSTSWVMLNEERIAAQVEDHAAASSAALPAEAGDRLMTVWVVELAGHLTALLEPADGFDERTAFATVRAAAGLAAECARRDAGPDPDGA